jgi:tryptophan synthase beta chain
MDKLVDNNKVRAIAVEPTSCPKLTRGVFRYDFGDTVGMTPLIPMYTLGHNFVPSPIHAGGLRYHGAGAIISQLLKDGIIEADAINQIECFEAGVLFSRTEGVIPAPEANHAIAEVIRQARQADEEGVSKTILFNLCGHGHFDLSSYEQFMAGKLVNYEVSQEQINASLAELDTPVI